MGDVTMQEALHALLRAPFDPGHRLFVGHLATALVVAVVLGWRAGHRGSDLRKWLLPRRILLHGSTATDIAFTVLNTMLAPARAALGASFTTLVAVAIASAFDHTLGPPGWLTPTAFTPAALTLSLLAVTDFTHWANHWLAHHVPWLWRFHSVHHSAAVLTPFTLYRRHPVYDLVKLVVQGLVVGPVQGLLVYLFAGPLSLWTVAGANGLFVLFLAVGSNLRHSHVWWSWGAVDWVFLSPAQHQLHHSIDPAHEGNYGSILSIWDSLAGTRVAARTPPANLRMGLPPDQTHRSMIDALLRPFLRRS